MEARLAPHRRLSAGPLGYGTLGVLLALGAWQMLPHTGLVTSQQIPSAIAVGERLTELVTTGEFWTAVGATLAGFGIGLLVALIAGVLIGTLMGSFVLVRDSLTPVVEFLRPVPGIALIPAVILMFGPGLTSDVALVAFGCVWVIIIQTLYGIRAVDEVALQTAFAFGLNRWERVRVVQVPSALPYIVTGLRIASGIALIVAVTAELIAGNPGLGSSITQAQSAARTTDVYAYIVTAGLLGIAVHLLFGSVEQRALHWHPSQRVGR